MYCLGSPESYGEVVLGGTEPENDVLQSSAFATLKAPGKFSSWASLTFFENFALFITGYI